MTYQFSLEHGMSVRRCGDATGPELVWIHGLGESSASFERVVAHPALAEMHHVLVDLPGYGRSAWPDVPATLALTAERLAAWLGERAPAVLVGHSMGGVLATLCGERGVARAVIDVEGNLTRGDCTFSAMAAAYGLAEFRATGFAAMRRAVFARGLEEEPLQGYHAAMMFASPDVFHAHAADLVRMSEAEDLCGRLVAQRHLYVAGVPGGICAYSRGMLDAAKANWVGIEPAAHWVYLDQLDAFAHHVAAFVAAL